MVAKIVVDGYDSESKGSAESSLLAEATKTAEPEAFECIFESFQRLLVSFERVPG